MSDIQNILEQYKNTYMYRITTNDMNYCRHYCSSDYCNNEYPCLNFELYHRLRFLEDILFGAQEHNGGAANETADS